MMIHEARITPADTDRLTGPIKGIDSNSANLQLNTHARESDRLQPLDPNGIVFEGSQTRYEEMRGAVSEVLRDIGIRDGKDREEMLLSFDRLHEGEEKAVADFQAALGDFKDGIVDPILQQFSELIKEAQKTGSQMKIDGKVIELTSLISGYLLADYLRRHLKGSQHPSSHRTARSINKLGRSLSWVAVGSTLLAACVSATGTISSTSTSSPTPHLQATNSPEHPPTPVPDPTVTQTLTETSTVTPTPTKTPNPTETQRPSQIVFQRDFNNGQLDIVKASPNHWNVLHQDGTKVEVIKDSTNSVDASGNPRGYVMKVSINGDPVQHPEWGNNSWWRNGFPDWFNGYPNKTVQAPSFISVDVYKPSSVDGIGLLSTHNADKISGNKFQVVGIQVFGDKLRFLVRGPIGVERAVWLKDGLFRSDAWVNLRIEFNSDRSVTPYVNGVNAYQDQTQTLYLSIDPNFDIGFSDGHAGFQDAKSDKVDGHGDGEYILNDNFVIGRYK